MKDNKLHHGVKSIFLLLLYEEAIKFTVLEKDFKKGLNLYKLRISTTFGENDLLN